MYTIGDLKKNLKKVLKKLEKVDPKIKIRYCVPDQGGYTDGIEITDFELDVTIYEPEDDEEKSSELEAQIDVLMLDE